MRFFAFLSLMLLTSYSEAADNTSPNNLNTVFTTPELRKKLNTLRDSGHFDSVTHTSPATATSSSGIKLQGVIIRDNARPVAFVNDSITTNQSSSSQTNSVLSANKNTLNVSLKANNKIIRLKPGQSWHSQNQKPSENYLLPDTSSDSQPDNHHAR